MTAPSAPPRELPRKLGFVTGMAVVVGMIIGVIIGSGIFRVPSPIAAADNLTGIALVWILAGVVALFGALSIAELAVMYPEAGGPYVYLREAYGRPLAFLFGWMWLLTTPISWTAQSLRAVPVHHRQHPDHAGRRAAVFDLDSLAVQLFERSSLIVASLPTSGQRNRSQFMKSRTALPRLTIAASSRAS